jgi:hypothetical protein
MPKRLLSEPKETGGILQLPDTLKLCPDGGHVIYKRDFKPLVRQQRMRHL